MNAAVVTLAAGLPVVSPEAYMVDVPSCSLETKREVDILHQAKTGDARFDIDTGAVAEQALEGQQFAAVGREDLSSTLALLPPFIPPRSFLLSRM